MTAIAHVIGRAKPAAFWIYLGLITAAELLIAYVSPMAGLLICLTLVAALVIHAALAAQPEERTMALGLLLAPLVRLVALGMPLGRWPVLAAYPAVAIPTLIATILVCRASGLTAARLGLTSGRPLEQLGIAASGPALGLASYWLLRPQPLLGQQATWQQLALAALLLALSTGAVEELMFRGVIQSSAAPLLDRWAVPFVAVLFAAMHLGHRSPAMAVLMLVVGLLFGLAAQRTGSILGVVLAHGIANVLALLALPALSRAPSSAAWTWLLWLAGLGALGAVAAGVAIFRRQATTSQAPEALIEREQGA
ncbi:CPBP family intramembrane metalloprotease [Chloroflexia bacterium SDU3-3]|nr:CPBP family intramembrane metalloprotease [Chloroflexia bacterium SDU3-3]